MENKSPLKLWLVLGEDTGNEHSPDWHSVCEIESASYEEAYAKASEQFGEKYYEIMVKEIEHEADDGR